MASFEIIISGQVQGVSFRAMAKDVAERLGLKGWIKNTGEGNVEAFVCGTKDDLEYFISWCHQGPPKAKVEKVKVTPVAEQTLTGFKILR